MPPAVPDQVNAMALDETGTCIADLEREVDSVINVLKLPVDILDMNDSHSDSDFESDSDWTVVNVILFQVNHELS